MFFLSNLPIWNILETKNRSKKGHRHCFIGAAEILACELFISLCGCQRFLKFTGP